MRSFIEIFNEGRVSTHQFTELSLQDAYKQSYKIFIDLGFKTASTFAIWDFIYRILPNDIKSDEVKLGKQKTSGTALRPFVVNLINSNIKNIDMDQLKGKMLDRNEITQYLNKQDMGNRRTGLLKKLTKQSGYKVTRDY